MRAAVLFGGVWLLSAQDTPHSLAGYFHELEQATYPRTEELLAASWKQCDPRTIDLAQNMAAFEGAIESGSPSATAGAIKIALQIIRFRGDEKTAAQFRSLASPLTRQFWNERTETLVINGDRQPATTFLRAQAVELIAESGAQPNAAIDSWIVKTLQSSHDEQVAAALLKSLARLPELPARATAAIIERAAMPNGPAIRGRAIGVLGGKHLASPEVRAEILVALSDESPYVRAQAARAAGEGHFTEARARLQALANDPDDDVRRESGEALGRLR